MTRVVDSAQIDEWIAAGQMVICLDIRETSSHKYAPVKGGMAIHYNDIVKKSAELLRYRDEKIVIFSMNDPARCNRVAIAESNLTKIGFTQVYALSGGLINGWNIPTKRRALPGITNKNKNGSIPA